MLQEETGVEMQHNQDVHAFSMKLTLDLLGFIEDDNNIEACLERTIENQETETQHDKKELTAKCANVNLFDVDNAGFKTSRFGAGERQQEQRKESRNRDIVTVNSPAVEANAADVTELDSMASLIACIESLSLFKSKPTQSPEDRRNDVNVGLGQGMLSGVSNANAYDQVRT